MSAVRWSQRHGEILSSICSRYNEGNIRYFILRNYQGLPNKNLSKDVDVIVEPSSVKLAKDILLEEYINHGVANYYEVRFSRVHCCHGIDVNTKFGIHIDLIDSYISKGSEIFTFDELYSYTESYNDFRVLNQYFEGVMVFVYKQFNYKPVLKEEYKEIIYNTHIKFPEFKKLISRIAGDELSKKIFHDIMNKNFDSMLMHSEELTKALRRYAFKKNPAKTLRLTFEFYFEKISRIIFNYNKFSKVFSVMAPDGAGKSTFLDALIDEINFYFVNDIEDHRCNVYHFRPNLLPNLGAIGESAGIKEQDKDFTNPHRSKPSNWLGSLFRITYYWLDYILGYYFYIRKDVQYDRFSIFDRYSYDLLVDPLRTKLNLPLWIRKIFVITTPQPKIVFYLDTDTDVIYGRKKELTLDEIARQNIGYKKVVASHKRFISLDSNRSVKASVDDALKILIESFTEKL